MQMQSSMLQQSFNRFASENNTPLANKPRMSENRKSFGSAKPKTPLQARSGGLRDITNMNVSHEDLVQSGKKLFSEATLPVASTPQVSAKSKKSMSVKFSQGPVMKFSDDGVVGEGTPVTSRVKETSSLAKRCPTPYVNKSFTSLPDDESVSESISEPSTGSGVSTASKATLYSIHSQASRNQRLLQADKDLTRPLPSNIRLVPKTPRSVARRANLFRGLREYGAEPQHYIGWDNQALKQRLLAFEEEERLFFSEESAAPEVTLPASQTPKFEGTYVEFESSFLSRGATGLDDADDEAEADSEPEAQEAEVEVEAETEEQEPVQADDSSKQDAAEELVSSMTCDKIRAELKKRGLKVGGLKAVISERLVEAMSQE